MEMNISKKNDIVVGSIIIILSFLFEKIAVSTNITYINVILASFVLLGALIDNIEILLVGSVVNLMLFKYSPFLSIELLFLFLISILIFTIIKKILLKRNAIVTLVFLVMSITLFWLAFAGIYDYKIFIKEIVYTIIWVLLLSEIIVWVKKKFL